MDLYYIDDKYIDYLRTFDEKVALNKNKTRPYIGIVLSINGSNFYAPLSSPKPKHIKMKNALDFRKIDGGRLGAINFNNMIPVSEEALTRIIIKDVLDDEYRNLLFEQYEELLKDEANIKNTAYILYKILKSDDIKLNNYQVSLKKRCTNIKLLESIYKDFSL